MEDRHISDAEVEEAVTDPETTYPSAEDANRQVVLGSTITDRRLKVVLAAPNLDVVVTVADRDSEV